MSQDLLTPPPPTPLTAPEIGGKLVYDIIMAQGELECKSVINTPCTNILSGKAPGIAEHVSMTSVLAFTPDGVSHVQTTSFDFKREALAVFLALEECTQLDAPVAEACPQEPCTKPTHGPCYTKLRDVNSEEYAHLLKVQLEKQYNEDGTYSTLLGQVALADALAANGKVGKIKDAGPVLGVLILLCILVVGGILFGVFYYLVKVRGVSLPFYPSEAESLLPLSKGKVQLANRGRASTSAGASSGDAGAAEELRNKLTRLREQRAKELMAHD